MIILITILIKAILDKTGTSLKASFQCRNQHSPPDQYFFMHFITIKLLIRKLSSIIITKRKVHNCSAMVFPHAPLRNKIFIKKSAEWVNTRWSRWWWRWQRWWRLRGFWWFGVLHQLKFDWKAKLWEFRANWRGAGGRLPKINENWRKTYKNR